MKLRLFMLAGVSLVAITSGCQKKVAVATPHLRHPVVSRVARAVSSNRASAAVASKPEPRPASVVATTHTAKTLEDYLNQLLDAFFDYERLRCETTRKPR